MKFGFDEKLERALESEKDHIFGAAPLGEVLVDNGDWQPHLVEFETQRKSYDGYICVSMANNNIEEMMHLRRYGVEVNRSDRWLGVASGTVPGRGNSHNKVADTKHKKGVVDEEDYPFTASMLGQEFYKPLTKELWDLGLKWKIDREYSYQKVNPGEFKEALRYSPLQVAVDSRTNRSNQVRGYDHSVVLTALDTKAHIFDSYPGRHLEYDVDYPFSFGLRFHYKQLMVFDIGGYEMSLVRNAEKGNIYFVDSDNVLHHCEAPHDFFEFFGNKAWQEQKWVNITPDELSRYEEGESITMKRTGFGALANLFKTFGKS